MIRVFTNPRYGDQEPDCLTVIHSLADLLATTEDRDVRDPADTSDWPRPRFARPAHPSSR
jgi:hypothetical protein